MEAPLSAKSKGKASYKLDIVDMKRKIVTEDCTNACRASTVHVSETRGRKDLRNAKAQRSLVKTLRNVVHDAMEGIVRRYACLSCAALFQRDSVERRGPLHCATVRRSAGFKHVLGTMSCYDHVTINVGSMDRDCTTSSRGMDADGVVCADSDLRMYVNVCTWCTRLWSIPGNQIQEGCDGQEEREIVSCPTLNILPWNEIPEAVRHMGDMESTGLSCISLRAKIVFGAGTGNVQDAVSGDFKYGEDCHEGREGLLCGEVKWTTEVVAQVRDCLKALFPGKNKNPYVARYLTSAELWTDGVKAGGEPLLNPRDVEAFHVDGRPEQEDVGALFRTGWTRLWKTKKLVNSTTAARCIRRPERHNAVTVPEDVTFDMDVEGRAFPCLYVNGKGSWDSRDWHGECQVTEEEWLEKRMWSVDPRFRRNRVWMYAHYDRRQKDALYTMPNFISLDAGIGDEEAEAAAWVLRRSRAGCHDLGIEELRAGVRGVAAACDEYGDANLFVTITMSESDMPWIQNVLASVGGSRGAAHEPSVCAYYFSHLVEVLIVKVFGDRRAFGGLSFYVYRLENQSQRANKLHAHCILRVKACESELKCSPDS